MIDQIIAKMEAEAATSVSDAEIERCLSGCVSASKLIPLAKKIRDENPTKFKIHKTTPRMKAALFKIGDRVQYTGSRQTWREVKGKLIPIIAPGMIVTIAEAKPPHKGLGFIKNDEDGDPIIDYDRDGCNVYKNDDGQSRLIWPEHKSEWKKL